MAIQFRRREFIGTLGSVAVGPVAARAQQPGRLRRVGVPLPYAESDLLTKGRIRLLLQQQHHRLSWPQSQAQQTEQLGGSRRTIKED